MNLFTITKENNSRLKDYEFLRQAINNAWAYIEFDPDGYILEANENFLDVIGYQSNEVVGKHHSMFCESSYAQSSEYKSFWLDLKSGEVKSGEFVRLTKNNSTVVLSASYMPITEKTGEVKRVVKIAKDISEMVEARSEARWIRSAVDMGWSMVEFDTQGNVLSANDNFVKALGYQYLKDIIGKHHSIFCSSDYAESSEYKQFWHKLREGEKFTGQYQRLTKTGDKIWLYASYTPVKNELGHVVKVIKIASDVTHSVQEKEELGFLIEKKLNKLCESLTQDSLHMNEMMNEVNSTIEESSMAVSEIASGARFQSQHVDEISELLSQVNDFSKESRKNATEIKEITEEGAERISEGVDTMKNVSESVDKISVSANETRNAVVSLENLSKQISSIVNVISGVASQTNLLALNAAIEASKAGESGKGFAVVADRIRLLAEESKKSTKEIFDVIENISVDIGSVNACTDEMIGWVENGRNAAEQAQSVFDNIQVNMSKSLASSVQIESATMTQDASIKEVVEAVEKIVVVSEQTAAGANELEQSQSVLQSGFERALGNSERLTGVASELRSVIKSLERADF